MRIAVVGAGAVGGVFGARLAAAGHDVTFLARGTTLEVLRAQGLREGHLFVHQPDDADALSTLATLQQALGRPASPPPPAGQLTLL
jgi:2-dehydropantoate 2-reductase